MTPKSALPLRRDVWIALLLSAAISVVNAAKPVHADDWAYINVAREFAAHPGTPYVFTYHHGVDGNDTLAPPVVPYCLAVVVAAGHTDPFTLKLALLPFVIALLTSLRWLLAWAGAPYPLLFAAAFVLGPGFLPGINCMLDMPALAFAATAVAVQLAAVRHGSWSFAVAAGVAAGLGMQAKYSAASVVPVLALAGLMFGRPRLGVSAAAAAVAVAVAVEGWLAVADGKSHFLAALDTRSGSPIKRMSNLLIPFVTIVGVVALVPTLLIYASLGRRRAAVAAAALALLTPVALAVVPASWQTWKAPHRWDPYHPLLTMSDPLFFLAGLFTLDALRRCAGPAATDRTDRFLIAWVGLEFLGMLALSPFPAVRRLPGVGLALLVLAGRVAGRNPPRPRTAAAIAAVGIALGIAYEAFDWAEAGEIRRGTLATVERAKELSGGHPVLFRGIDTARYYSLEAGLPMFYWQGQPEVGTLIIIWQGELNTLYAPDFPAGGVKGVELVETIPMDLPAVYLGNQYYSGRRPLTRLCGPPGRGLIFRVTGPMAPP